MPGNDLAERIAWLFDRPGGLGERTAEVSVRLNDFLRDAVKTVREYFRGKLTYAWPSAHRG
ncbi:hypothetical protein FPZ12_004810 [Amycolatopsis acidicola]|uniref:Uncharacterized protein n=1 Tax=Amycolatopsis acidicola TaxID=2596893 RepID=A0A5N0VHF9_9PSEU|nr:hypothetical protein [Amycolatopsis acidicola]KAA9165807.1 hypothetical protein FPZ12_004810 [Amycolatopsis acidicola]